MRRRIQKKGIGDMTLGLIVVLLIALVILFLNLGLIKSKIIDPVEKGTACEKNGGTCKAVCDYVNEYSAGFACKESGEICCINPNANPGSTAKGEATLTTTVDGKQYSLYVFDPEGTTITAEEETVKVGDTISFSFGVTGENSGVCRAAVIYHDKKNAAKTLDQGGEISEYYKPLDCRMKNGVTQVKQKSFTVTQEMMDYQDITIQIHLFKETNIKKVEGKFNQNRDKTQLVLVKTYKIKKITDYQKEECALSEEGVWCPIGSGNTGKCLMKDKTKDLCKTECGKQGMYKELAGFCVQKSCLELENELTCAKNDNCVWCPGKIGNVGITIGNCYDYDNNKNICLGCKDDNFNYPKLTNGNSGKKCEQTVCSDITSTKVKWENNGDITITCQPSYCCDTAEIYFNNCTELTTDTEGINFIKDSATETSTGLLDRQTYSADAYSGKNMCVIVKNLAGEETSQQEYSVNKQSAFYSSNQ